jgi:hypothetical protein
MLANFTKPRCTATEGGLRTLLPGFHTTKSRAVLDHERLLRRNIDRGAPCDDCR